MMVFSISDAKRASVVSTFEDDSHLFNTSDSVFSLLRLAAEQSPGYHLALTVQKLERL